MSGQVEEIRLDGGGPELYARLRTSDQEAPTIVPGSHASAMTRRSPQPGVSPSAPTARCSTGTDLPPSTRCTVRSSSSKDRRITFTRRATGNGPPSHRSRCQQTQRRHRVHRHAVRSAIKLRGRHHFRYDSVVAIPVSKWYVLWQWSIHWPGLSASMSNSTEDIGSTLTVSLRALPCPTISKV